MPLWGNGLCEVFYTFFQPSRALAVMMVADLWVNALPSQVCRYLETSKQKGDT